MGHTRKRTWTTADGTRRTAWQARWIDLAGVERSRTWPTKGAAETWLRRVANAQADGHNDPTGDHAPTGVPTVAAWMTSWLAGPVAMRVATGGLAASTATRYDSNARLHIFPHIGHLPLDELRPSHIETMMAAVMADGSAAATARKARTALSSALTAATKDGLIPANPALSVDLPPVPDHTPATFDDDELAAIVAGWQGHRHAPLWGLISLTGLRSSEALGLRWDDVNLDDATLTMGHTIHRVGAAPLVGLDAGDVAGGGKTRGSRRTVPLVDPAVQLLAEHRHRQVQQRLAAPSWDDSGYVFTTADGAPLRPESVRRSWQRLLADVDVAYQQPDPTRPGRAMQALRRTWASRLAAAGIPVSDLMALGGWSSARVPMSFYVSIPMDQLRESAGNVAL